MDSLIVATVQQQMMICGSHAEYREELRRFLKVATAKRARLIIFPELGGLVVAPPLMADLRSTLIKRAEMGRARRAGLIDRLRGAAADWVASWLRADLRVTLAGLLDVAHADIWSAYCETFGSLAREFGVTVVAPSGYFPDPRDGVIRSLTGVFDDAGELVGTQTKVVLHAEDKDLAQPGGTWDVIPTPVGRMGLILGADVLFPEVGRLLAYQGADMLVVQAASTSSVLYQKLRTGVLARMQDNQLFAAASFLVGPNRMSRGNRVPYVGKSAIFAPQELTPRKSGVLVEMTSHQSEGVLTAVWDYAALRELWETSDTPVRRELPLDQAGQILGQLYSRLEHLPRLLSNDLVEQTGGDALVETESAGRDAAQLEGAAESASGVQQPADTDDPETGAANADALLLLDDLEVRSSITSRWPLVGGTTGHADAMADGVIAADLSDEDLEEGALPDTSLPDASLPGASSLDATSSDSPETPGGNRNQGEDETDEMDALPKHDDAR